MKCGHLFNGIGGFALAASWVGWENVFHCEIDNYCNRVMRRHFPNSTEHGNIKEQNFTIYNGTIDLISGGFPCQPYSIAGKRLGKDDERHLWPEMLRAIREIQPRWVVGENVRGLTNWNGGMVFDEVQADLEAEGYEVLPFLLPAAGVGAPHRRDRIWFIAHAAGRGHRRFDLIGENRRQEEKDEGEAQREEWDEAIGERFRYIDRGVMSATTITDPDLDQRTDGRMHEKRPITAVGHPIMRDSSDNREQDWRQFPTKSPVHRRNDGVPNRLDRIAALGNAIVPQVALQIFRAIQAYEVKYYSKKI
jgi:DNA (cytosine-5)-methyltransferase 1